MTTTTPTRPVAEVSGGRLTGLPALLRFALRRDRVRLPAWVLGISLTVAATAAMFPGVYPDFAAQEARAALMGSPATVALAGPQIGVDNYTFGAMMTNEMLALTSIVVALMSIFMVVRHTRGEEETGRSELVLANPVGQLAPMAAGLAMAVIANVALWIVTAVTLAGQGIESIDWPGSILYGAALASVGLVFAGVAAVAAQITEHARTASSMAGLVLGLVYTIRAVGDVLESPISWLSPVGWAQRTYAFVADQWWPLLLSLVLTIALVIWAVALNSRRDFGSGLRQPKPGPSEASPRLSSAFALAVHNQRVSISAWAVSLGLFGLMYGSLLGEVEGFAEKLGSTLEDVLGELMSASLINGFLSFLAVMISMFASVYAANAVLRARNEENAGLSESVLATPTSRAKFLAGHVTVAFVGGAIVLFAGLLGIATSGSAALGASVIGDLMGAATVQLVPLLVVVSVAVALFGLVPRLTGLVWVLVGYSMFALTLGGLVGLPDWAIDLPPFAMVPALPAEPFTLWTTLGLMVLAVALLTAGFWGFARRDLQTVA